MELPWLSSRMVRCLGPASLIWGMSGQMVKNNHDVMLMAHLLRRVGFGAPKSELEEYVALGYEQTVDLLLQPNEPDQINDALVRRYFPDQSVPHESNSAGSYWLYRLVSTDHPLKEKMVLLWHNLFATGYAKVTNGKPLTDQLTMFRKYGMGSFDNLLLQLSRDPAMIIWLDNIDNHNGAINENYGRELLELFSMGVGNYTEDDIKECARAFTGWTVANSDYTKQLAVRNSIWPYGKQAWRYEYTDEDHDDGPKSFLGETGRFNGEDIIAIICRQPATARFISRHLYHFFVADEPPVSQWPYEEPQDMEAMRTLEKAYFDGNYNISDMLRVLFNSEFFKSEDCHYKKIKSPAELVTGVLRITEEFGSPKIGLPERNSHISFMGQQLLNPPSVEGWHQGLEWIETGSIMQRINFASRHLGDTSNLGVKKIVQNILGNEEEHLSAESCIDRCLDELGAVEASEYIRDTLIAFADETGLPEMDLSTDRAMAEEKLSTVLSVVGSIPEYQRS